MQHTVTVPASSADLSCFWLLDESVHSHVHLVQFPLRTNQNVWPCEPQTIFFVSPTSSIHTVWVPQSGHLTASVLSLHFEYTDALRQSSSHRSIHNVCDFGHVYAHDALDAERHG